VADQEPVPASEVTGVGDGQGATSQTSVDPVRIEPARPIKFADRVIPIQTSKWSYQPATILQLPAIRAGELGLVVPREGPRGGRGRSGFPPGMNMPGGPPAGAPDSDPAPEGDGADIEFVSPRVAGLARSDDGQSIALLYTDPFTSCSFVDSIQVESDDHRTASMPATGLALNANTRTIIRLADHPDVTTPVVGIKDYDSLEVISEKTGKHFYTPLGIPGFTDIETAAFVNDRIAVVFSRQIDLSAGKSGFQMTAIDVESGRAYRTATLEGAVFEPTVAVSPDREHIAIGTSSAVVLFNVVRGEPAGVLDMPAEFGAVCSFSPDGTRLAAKAKNRRTIRLFDLATGSQSGEFRILTRSALNESIHWPSDRFLLVNGQELVDVEHQLPVWRLQPAGNAYFGYLGGDQFWYSISSRGHVFSLPLDELARRMADISIEDATILRAGDSVTIQPDANELARNRTFGLAPGKIQEIHQNLTREFEERGVRVANAAPVILRISVDQLPMETMEVNERGGPPPPGPAGEIRQKPPTVVRFTPTRSRMELVRNGTVIWSREQVNRPTAVMRGEQGENPQMTANRLCRPRPGFFTLPFGDRFVLLSGNEPVLGTTRLGVAGPESE
jgi:hypothetical protein